MKVNLEGEPSEIIAFLQQFQSQPIPTPPAAIAAPPAAAPAPAAIEQVEEPEAPPQVERPPIHVVQAPIKDKITTFLEGRRKAKIKDISKALKLPAKKISPRIAELCADGRVARLTDHRYHNDYALVREGEPPKATKKAAKKAPKAKKAASPAPAPAPAPVVDLSTLPLKDQIIAFLAEREKAPLSEIRIALGSNSNKVSAQLVHLRHEGKLVKLDNENAPADYALTSKPEPVVAAPPAPPETSDDIAIKELIVEFLRDNPNSTVREIRTALGEKRGNTITARLVGLRQDGRINKIDREGKHAVYALVTDDRQTEPQALEAEPAKPEPSFEPLEEPLTSTQVEYLRIMDALVAHPNATYYDLERVTQMSRGILSSRLIDLEQMKLVERTGGRRSGPVEWMPVPPGNHNELPLFQHSLDDAIMEALKKHPGASAEQISILLMRSLKDVTKRLDALPNVAKRGDRYYMRGFTKA